MRKYDLYIANKCCEIWLRLLHDVDGHVMRVVPMHLIDQHRIHADMRSYCHDRILRSFKRPRSYCILCLFQCVFGFYSLLAEAIRTTVLLITQIIRTTVVPIRMFIGTKVVRIKGVIGTEAGQLGLVPTRPLSQLGLGSTRPGQLGLFIFLMVNRDITCVPNKKFCRYDLEYAR